MYEGYLAPWPVDLPPGSRFACATSRQVIGTSPNSKCPKGGRGRNEPMTLTDHDVQDVEATRLTLLDELVLTLLNEESGYFRQVPGWNLNCAVAGTPAPRSSSRCAEATGAAETTGPPNQRALGPASGSTTWPQWPSTGPSGRPHGPGPSPPSIRWMINSLPIAVRRALACDIEPPLLCAVVRNHHTGIGGSPHSGANNLYGQNT